MRSEGCVLIAWALVIAFTVRCSGQADNLGTEFIVVFMRNEVENPINAPLELFITTPRTIPVQVVITTPSYTQAPVNIKTSVVSGQVVRVDLSYQLRLDWFGVEKKVIYIHSDNAIAVYALNKEKYSTDGFLVYPLDVIGYEYYTISHTPTSSYSMFAIASKYNNTKISITFPDGTGRAIPLKVDYGGITYTHNDVLNITLKEYESFQVFAFEFSDLTGSHIVASMPVAVFSGNMRSWVGFQTSRDHLAVQLPPVQAFGKEFPIVPIPGRTVGDYVRVLSSEPNALITVQNIGTKQYTLQSITNYVDFIIPSNTTTRVTSDKPILVVQLAQSQISSDEPADPTMLVVTAYGQYMSDYVFSTPQYYDGGSYDNWLMVVVSADEVNGLMLDSKPFSQLNPSWIPIPGTSLVGAQIQIESGPHAIRHISPIAKFSGYLYGSADRESYSFQIGTRMALINQPCVKTSSVFGDGIDNDCDGKIDEELCTGTGATVDNDGDGSINEDCAIGRDILEGAPDSGGRQFVIFFMENSVDSPRFIPLEVYATPLRSAVANVQVETPKWFEPAFFQRKEVTFGSVETFYIPYTLKESGTGMTSKALFITSDQDIAVYAVNREQYSADAFLALPIDVLGKHYYAVTHYPNSDSSKCQIGVVGVSDGTRVDITFPSRSTRGIIQVEYNGVSYTNGDTLSVVINRFSTLQIQSKGDLTGTEIKATQKVGVMSGNIRTSVGDGSSRDHLVSMLPATDSWGRFYCTVPIPGRSTGDFFYILAAENDTIVEVTSKQNYTLHAGESVQLLISSMQMVAIRSNKPILVVQISQSQSSALEVGDPTMIVLPSQEQWANAYTFSTTTAVEYLSSDVEYQNYLVLVAPADQLSGLLVDGKRLPSLFTTWYQVAGTNYSGTSFLIKEGVHTVQHVDPTVTFSVIVYGNADKESYGFPAGMRLAQINAPCEVTVDETGDGIDNDCDGKIDEEICYGEGVSVDEDGDSRVDEDCAIYIPPVTQASTTTTASYNLSSSATTVTTQRPAWMIVGPPGPPGAVGPAGPAGPQGAPGYNGYPGSPGQNGVDGNDGAKGEIGATGLTGAAGATGIVGPVGSTGVTGATGVTGLKGDRGEIGSTGLQGEPGQSIKGDPGITGLPGESGKTGLPGEQGATGATGVKGQQGLPGAAGATGVKGEPGLKGEMGPAYLDINECSGSNPCSDECVNTIGSFYCKCREGYKLDASQHNCIDMNECSVYNGGCADKCTNTEGSFTCLCSIPGYTLANDHRSCADVDECSSGVHGCGTDHICINSIGSYVCLNVSNYNSSSDSGSNTVTTGPCAPGRTLSTDGKTCVDVNECLTDNGGCMGLCENIDGSFLCRCANGYQLGQDMKSCADNDECLSEAGSVCSDSQVCVNSIGSFVCLSKSADAVSNAVNVVSPSILGSLDTSSLLDGNIMLGILIWLVVITVLLLVLLGLICKQSRDHESVKRNVRDDMRELYKSIEHSARVPYKEMPSDYGNQSNGSSLSYA